MSRHGRYTWLKRLDEPPSGGEMANKQLTAVIESFWSTLKAECATGVYSSRSEARQSIFEHIEVWYNRRRRHSGTSYVILFAPGAQKRGAPVRSVRIKCTEIGLMAHIVLQRLLSIQTG